MAFTAKEIWKLIDSYKSFDIIGHKEPDGDCLGSQLALYYHLSRAGKNATLYSPGPFFRNEVNAVAQMFIQELPAQADPESLVIVLDCSSPDRLGNMAPIIDGRELLVIDHHSTGKPFSTDKTYIDPKSPSTTLLVQEILEESGLDFDRDTAYWLFFGFCTDTGFFRHLEQGNAAHFAAASRLLVHDISPRDVFMEMYGGKLPESRQLIGRILAGAEFSGPLCICVETLEMGGGSAIRDSDSLYQLLLTTKGIEIIIYLREEEDGSVSGGIRTREKIDAGLLAKQFGGGGHARAAGLSWDGTIGDLKEKIRARAAELLG